jgi:hypothetical protein
LYYNRIILFLQIFKIFILYLIFHAFFKTSKLNNKKIIKITINSIRLKKKLVQKFSQSD